MEGGGKEMKVKGGGGGGTCDGGVNEEDKEEVEKEVEDEEEKREKEEEEEDDNEEDEEKADRHISKQTNWQPRTEYTTTKNHKMRNSHFHYKCLPALARRLSHAVSPSRVHLSLNGKPCFHRLSQFLGTNEKIMSL